MEKEAKKVTRTIASYSFIAYYDSANCFSIEFDTYCLYEKAVTMVSKYYGTRDNANSNKFKFTRKAYFNGFVKSVSELL